MTSLLPGLTAAHDALAERLERAVGVRRDPDGDPLRLRDDIAPRVEFLSAASRHLAAVEAVLLPAVRRQLDDGTQRARTLLRQCRRLEVALAQARGKLAGSAYAVGRTWSSVWSDVRQEFDATWELEAQLVEQLDRAGAADGLAERLEQAEERAPTRTHPYVPHVGLPGRVARRVTRRVDDFWDNARGWTPPPVVPRPRDED